MTQNKSLCAAAVALALASGSAFATNGMNMDAYGPIAGGVGGASQAYDNGTAALMNNPATLGMMAEGDQLDLALGFLNPRINADMPAYPGAAEDSAADLFLMPAIGYATRTGKLTLAGGVFAQGGMGAEYSAMSDFALGSGDKVRSEVGVGRAMLAAAYNVDDRFNIGGSVDFVWAGMDLMMAIPTDQLGSLTDFTKTNPNWYTQNIPALGNVPAFTALGGLDWGRFDFSNSSKMFGEAKGYGIGGKIGMTYKVSDMVSVGASYHTQTKISDMESDNATLSAGPTGGSAAGAFTGSIAVNDFQWPATYGLGVSITPSDSVQIAMDVKRIKWSDVMDQFRMTFTETGGLGLGDLAVAMDQNWKDQTVVQGGVAYKVNPKLVVRGGFNFASNPVPDSTVNHLFPATIEQHYTLGFGYQTSDAGVLNASLTYAPEVTVTSGAGAVISHKQFAGQVMYSHRF